MIDNIKCISDWHYNQKLYVKRKETLIKIDI